MHLPVNDRHFACFGESYQTEQIEAAIRCTPGRGLAVDVGAHVGFWSKELKKHFHKVVAIEPVAENYALLQKNVPLIVAFNVACGDTRKRLKLSNPTPENSGAWTAEAGDETECITLDSLGLSPDLIKIDVQGYELEVLKGAARTLERASPTLCVEVVLDGVENTDLIRHIKSIGYRLVESVNKDRIYVRSA